MERRANASRRHSQSATQRNARRLPKRVERVPQAHVAEIGPLEADDLPEVTSPYELLMRSRSRLAPPGLRAYFERFLFGQPWLEVDIPSLVDVADNGKIGGWPPWKVEPSGTSGNRSRDAGGHC